MKKKRININRSILIKESIMNKLLLIFIFLTVFRDCYFQSDNQQELIYRELGYAEPNNNLKSKYELDYNKF